MCRRTKKEQNPLDTNYSAPKESLPLPQEDRKVAMTTCNSQIHKHLFNWSQARSIQGNPRKIHLVLLVKNNFFLFGKGVTLEEKREWEATVVTEPK